MSDRVDQLRKTVHLLRRSKAIVIFGLPAFVSVLWMFQISEHFSINGLAIKSGVFVFVAFLVPLVLVHAFCLAIYQQRLADATRDAQLPRAIARDLGETPRS